MDEEDNSLSKFADCLTTCAGDQLGVSDVLSLAGIVLGAPFVPKSFITPGSSPATSILSSLLSGELGSFDMSQWAPTLARPFARTRDIGRFAARWIPFVGGVVLAADTIAIGFCVADCMNGEGNE